MVQHSLLRLRTRRSQLKRQDSWISAISATYSALAGGAAGPSCSTAGSCFTATPSPRNMHSYTSPNPPLPCT